MVLHVILKTVCGQVAMHNFKGSLRRCPPLTVLEHCHNLSIYFIVKYTDMHVTQFHVIRFHVYNNNCYWCIRQSIYLMHLYSFDTYKSIPLHTSYPQFPHLNSKMFLTATLFFGAILLANGCSMDLINCTIPYGDLNISKMDVAEYCLVDNCTVKITKTGDELNIAYYNDQYLVSCDQKTTAVLLEVNDTTINNLCEPGKNAKPSLFIQIMEYFVTLLVTFVNISILIIIVKQNKYTSLPIHLLIPSYGWYVEWL